MPSVEPSVSSLTQPAGIRSRFFSFLFAGLLAALGLLSPIPPLRAAQQPLPEIMPLSQVKPGMKGIAYTIFAGDTVEPIDLVVIGILPNLLGPKQDIILVELKGAKAEHSGVVAGMSGSPVYIDGKLVGALSLKFGSFVKEPLGGVTPIEQMLEVRPEPMKASAPMPGPDGTADASDSIEQSVAEIPALKQYPVPSEWTQRAGIGNGAAMMQIETPLIFSGVKPEVFNHFANQLAAYGMVAAPGGTTAPQSDDANIKAGDMVGMVLVNGDLSLAASCTITLITGDRVYVCGHPLFGVGSVEMPMARGRVLATLSSSQDSTKIVNAGGVIGTIVEDRTTAVMGRMGAGPKMIPMELTLATPGRERKFHFGLMNNPKLTPLLIGITTMNGLIGNPMYGEGNTLRLTGEIQIAGHSPVTIENLYSPTDAFVPDGAQITATVQNIFFRIFSNPYEAAKIDRVSLRVESTPERRSAMIESAWAEKNEVQPGDELSIKVLLRPYRGAPFIQEVPIRIPPQAARGTTLRIQVSDSDTLNRASRVFTFGPQGRLSGLEQLITLLNRERRNNRVYVTLLQPTPTLLVEDKELPNAPASQVNILDQRRSAGNSLLLRESMAGEWSAPLNRVVIGLYSLTVMVK
jgi:hypothetical protein